MAPISSSLITAVSLLQIWYMVEKILLFSSKKKLLKSAVVKCELSAMWCRDKRRFRSSGVIAKTCRKQVGILTFWFSTYISHIPVFSSNIFSVVPETENILMLVRVSFPFFHYLPLLLLSAVSSYSLLFSH